MCSLKACHIWLTRNHMFIREILGKFTSFIFWNFEVALVLRGRFQNFKKVNSVNLPQFSLFSMWLLVQIQCHKPLRCIKKPVKDLRQLFFLAFILLTISRKSSISDVLQGIYYAYKTIHRKTLALFLSVKLIFQLKNLRISL